MHTDLFDFNLPESLIADRPASPRDSARMLVVVPPPLAGEGRVGVMELRNIKISVMSPSSNSPRKRGKDCSEAIRNDYNAPTPALPLMGRENFIDKTIRDLPSFLKPGDVMVFNDTKVIPARLIGKRGEAKVEILLHKQAGNVWHCFAKPAKRLKVADRIIFAPDFHAMVVAKLDDGQVALQFDVLDLSAKLIKHGAMPLPPYIEKKRHADSSDHSHYQTIYAKHEGSVAAPTAGLHFTPELLAAIDATGVKRAHVTLHVGGGTFLPVKTEDIDDHVMHSEYAVISEEAARTINEAKKAGGRVIAVGTTSLRTLESAADGAGLVQPYSRETSIFITPGYRFRAVDVLMTNFHLPKSTLFMLVSAFCGLERMQAAYAHAIARNYRFYSYGDGCLLFKNA